MIKISKVTPAAVILSMIILQQQQSVLGDKYDFMGRCISNTLLPNCHGYDKYICNNEVTCLINDQVQQEVRSRCPLEQLAMCDRYGDWIDYSRGVDPSSYSTYMSQPQPPASTTLEEEEPPASDPFKDPFVVPATTAPLKTVNPNHLIPPSTVLPAVMPADPSKPFDPYDILDSEGPLLISQPEEPDYSCRDIMPSCAKPHTIVICGDIDPICVTNDEDLQLYTLGCPEPEIDFCLENSHYIYIPTGHKFKSAAGSSQSNTLVWSSLLGGFMVAAAAMSWK